MVKMKKSIKGKKVMIEKEELERIISNQVDRVSVEVLSKAFSDKIMMPFENIITELEEKREEIEDLKADIEDLAN